jgi:FAD:protein FMN transferase
MQSREIHMMGTIIQLMIQHDNANFVLDEMINQLKEYEKRFSAHDPTSELMMINKNAGIMPVKVNPDLYELIKIGKLHSTATDSKLNIAIGPLVQTWRIGFKDAQVPSEKTIQSLLSKTKASNIILDDQNQTVFLKHTGMFIDLGALAKGYIADLIIRYLENVNAQAALINLGGNVVTYGFSSKQEDGYWRIGIQHPLLPRGNYIAILRAFNQSVVTSGIYERKFTMNNQTYHHILDPNTGYPVQSEIAGLTVVSKKSVDGEIWTSRLFGQSATEIISTLNQIKDVAGIVITKNSELYYSESLKPYLIESVSSI